MLSIPLSFHLIIYKRKVEYHDCEVMVKDVVFEETHENTFIESTNAQEGGE